MFVFLMCPVNTVDIICLFYALVETNYISAEGVELSFNLPP